MVQEKPSVRAPGMPVRRFKGILESYTPNPKTFGASTKMTYDFNFKGIEILETTEPYTFPIVVVNINYNPPSDKGKPGQGNRWEVMAASLRKLSPENPDLDLLVGHMQEWAQLPATLRLPLNDEEGNPQVDGNGAPVWGDVGVDCWQIVSVDGMGSVEEADADFNTFLVDLADGKTEPQFYSAALQNERVNARPNIAQALVDRKLLKTLMEMNLLSQDAEGILHKTSGEVPA